MRCRNFVQGLLCCITVMGLTTAASAEIWKPHVVRQLNGAAAEIRIPAKLQIVTEKWDRIAAVPYIIYMPEKDRMLMLVNCDTGPGNKPPHFAMVMTSDDRGVTWTDPVPVHRDAQGTPVGMGLGLTYMGQGRILLYTGEVGGNRWFSDDYGATWKDPVAVGPMASGERWIVWCPPLAERDETQGTASRLAETGYVNIQPAGSPFSYAQAHLRWSRDGGRTWTGDVSVPQWKGVNEVALLRAANGDWVAACRTDSPERFKKEIDHYEGQGVSISKDRGKTWSDVKKLYDWGRHHPSLLLMPNHDIVMTYVARKGYVDTPDGFPQFGIEAVVSHDNGRTWDLDHRYMLHVWAGTLKGPTRWYASSQQTSSVLLPDGSILTAFGTGYRLHRDVGLVQWRLGDQPLNGDLTIRDAPFPSDVRNVVDPATGGRKKGR